MDLLRDPVWQFVLGNLPVADFEKWCYETPDLESLLGKDFYLDVISTRFDDSESVQASKSMLYRWLRDQNYPTCECFQWASFQRIPLVLDWVPDSVDERFECLRERTQWLALRRCRRCRQAWYVACDTVDDDWYFRRMSEEEVGRVLEKNQWPANFDNESKYGLRSWW